MEFGRTYLLTGSDAWFGYGIQKMASIAASMATLAFNTNFIESANAALQYFDTESSVQGAVEFDYSVYVIIINISAIYGKDCHNDGI